MRGGTGGDSGSAGSSGGSGDGKVSLKIWVPEEEVEITDAMVKAFDESHDEYDIDYEIAITGIDESQAAIETDADTAADIFMLPSGAITGLKESGSLLPLTKGVDEIKAITPETAIEACTRDGEMYAIPWSLNSYFALK